MIGIIVATHGKLSEGLIDAAKVIFGAAENVERLQLNQGDDIEALNRGLLSAIQKVDSGDGVIVFTDLVGASPYNQTLLAIHSLPEDVQEKILVFSGVNLPMVIETLNHRMIGSDITTIASSITDAGKSGITYWTSLDNSLEDVEDSEDEDDDF